MLEGLLTRRRLMLVSAEPQPSPSVRDVLEEWLTRSGESRGILVSDTDPQTINAVLTVYSAGQLGYGSSLDLQSLRDFSGDVLIVDAASFAALFSGASNPPAPTRFLMLRDKLGRFLTGDADLLQLANQMRAAGYRLTSVIQHANARPVRGASDNLYFAFERSAGSDGTATVPPRAQFDVGEGLAHLSRPITKQGPPLLLASRGSGGFPAGILNPGVVEHEGELVLLARGEQLPWPVMKRSGRDFLTSCRPVALRFGADLDRPQIQNVHLASDWPEKYVRMEDFRLFRHAGQIYVNHSVLRLRHQDQSVDVRPERLRTSIGLSKFEPDKAQLTPLGCPMLDRPVAEIEKNWAFFSTGVGTHLIYSFQPYRLFSGLLPGLIFRQETTTVLQLPVPEDGLVFRNSINPVIYDERHLLHIVHKVFPGKRYVYWAVLLDRLTLQPVKMAPRPLLRATPSAGVSIVYACSAIVRQAHIHLFAGLDDSAIGFWRIACTDLDSEWQEVHATDADRHG